MIKSGNQIQKINMATGGGFSRKVMMKVEEIQEFSSGCDSNWAIAIDLVMTQVLSLPDPLNH